MTEPQHTIAMSIRSIRAGIDELAQLVPHISEHDQWELDLARYDIEQLLLKCRYPILRRESKNAA